MTIRNRIGSVAAARAPSVAPVDRPGVHRGWSFLTASECACPGPRIVGWIGCPPKRTSYQIQVTKPPRRTRSLAGSAPIICSRPVRLGRLGHVTVASRIIGRGAPASPTGPRRGVRQLPGGRQRHHDGYAVRVAPPSLSLGRQCGRAWGRPNVRLPPTTLFSARRCYVLPLYRAHRSPMICRHLRGGDGVLRVIAGPGAGVGTTTRRSK